MISLINLLKEAVSPYAKWSGILQRPAHGLFRSGDEAPMVMIVIYDDKGGLKDDKKRNQIKKIIERNLMHKAMTMDIDYAYLSPNTILDGLKYYPATDKIIGKLPKFFFKVGNKPSMKSLKFSYELSKVSPTLQIKEKK